MFRSVFYTCLLILLISPITTSAQCLIRDVPLSQRLQLTTDVIAGEVLGSSSMFNETDGHIYTRYDIRNLATEDTITLATRGGKWGKLVEVVNPSLKLQTHETGVFFLKSNTSNEAEFIPAVGLLSFLKYNEKTKDFSDALNIYDLKLIDQIELTTLLPYFETSTLPHTKTLLISPVINSLSPTVLTAGTGDILTITGSNFGDGAEGLALIEFRNPDLTGSVIAYQTVSPNHILTWTDNLIEVIVPGRDPVLGKSGAGSGKVRIRNVLGEATFSSEEITVRYNRYEEELERMFLIDDNTFGGYTFTYNQNFNTNSNLVDAFGRALETWQCLVHSNFLADGSSSTASCPANDGQNLISFDNDCPLSVELLAQSTQWFIECPSGSPVFLEIDVIFDAGTNWYAGTGSPPSFQFDFESVALHELGHAHGIGHVRESWSTMYTDYFSGEEKRYIDENTEECGHQIVMESSNLTSCGVNDPFIPLPDCNAPCELNTSAIQSSDCLIDDQVEYILSVTDINGGAGGFNVFIDGVLFSGSPFDYYATGLTIIDVLIVADGNLHNILVQDAAEGACSNEITVIPPNCQCALEMSVNPVSNCTPEGNIDYNLSISENNGGIGFSVFINDALENGSPYFYSGGANTIIQITLPGNGEEQIIVVQDLDDTECLATTTVTTIDCQCDLTLEAIQTSDCNEDDQVFYTLIIEDENGSADGFNLFIDGQPDGNNPYDYGSSGTTTLTVPVIGNASNYIFSVADLSDGNCIAADTVVTPDCICNIDFTLEQLTDCGLNDSLTYALNINHLNPGSSGFNVSLEGIILSDGPFDYDDSGTTIQHIAVFGDGSEYEVAIVDVENPFCTTTQVFSTPDCICDLGFTIEQVDDCGGGIGLNLSLTVSAQNGSTEGFDVWIDEMLAQGSPFQYDESGTTNLTLEVIGNGGLHSFTIQDRGDSNCTVSTSIYLPDCSCGISFQATPVGDCNEEGNIVYELSIDSENGSPTGFYIWLNGNLINPSPFPYEIDITHLSIDLPADGTSHNILIQDAEDIGCESSLEVSSQDCTCSISAVANIAGECDVVSDLIPIELTVEHSNGGTAGFQLFINGSLDENSPFSYEPSGTSIIDLNLPGDGSIYEFEIVDIQNTECIASTSIAMPGCLCKLSLLLEEAGECDNGEISLILSIISVNTGTEGFNLLFNGNVISGTPYQYDPSGFTTVEISVPANEEEYMLEAQDVEDMQCTSSILVELPDCTCILNSTISQNTTCDDGYSVWILAVEEENGGEAGFNVFLDDDLVAGSPFPYSDTGMSILDISVWSDGTAHSVEVVDAVNNDCSVNIDFTTIDCTCNLVTSTTQNTTCDDDGNVTWSINIEDTNGSSEGFNLFLDGDLVNESPFSYDIGGVTQVELSVPGDNIIHTYQIEDLGDFACIAEGVFLSPDCTCALDLEIVQIGDCTTSDSVIVLLLLEETNGGSQGFNIFIDDVLSSETPIVYSSTGENLFEVNLAGDGLAHHIRTEDIAKSDCFIDLEIVVPDCTCQLSFNATQITGCNEEGFTSWSLAIDNQNGSSAGFDVYLDNEIINVDHFLYTDPLTFINIDIPGDGETHHVEIRDASDNLCFFTNDIVAVDCQCQLWLDIAQLTTCDDLGMIEILGSLNHELVFSDSFRVLIDGLLFAENVFEYVGVNFSTFEISLPGDGSSHLIEIQDIQDSECMASAVFLSPDCIGSQPVCELAFIAIQTLDCENGNISVTMQFEGPQNEQSQYDVYENGVLNFLSPFSFHPSGLNTLNIELPCDTTAIQIVDQQIENCQIDTIIIPTFTTGAFNLYPNPILYKNTELTIEGIDQTDFDKLLPVTFYDVLGRRVFKAQLLGRPIMTLDINKVYFPGGLYYITIGNNARYSGKLIILD